MQCGVFLFLILAGTAHQVPTQVKQGPFDLFFDQYLLDGGLRDSSISGGAYKPVLLGGGEHLLITMQFTTLSGDYRDRTEGTSQRVITIAKDKSEGYSFSLLSDFPVVGPLYGRKSTQGFRFTGEADLPDVGRVDCEAVITHLKEGLVDIEIRYQQRGQWLRWEIYRLKTVVRIEESACRTNMKTIANAVQANHIRNRTQVYFTGEVLPIITRSDGVLTDLGGTPTCPNDGSYYYVTGRKDGFQISCKNPVHLFFWKDGTFHNDDN